MLLTKTDENSAPSTGILVSALTRADECWILSKHLIDEIVSFNVMYGHTIGGDTVGDGVLSNVGDGDKVTEPVEVGLGVTLVILIQWTPAALGLKHWSLPSIELAEQERILGSEPLQFISSNQNPLPK